MEQPINIKEKYPEIAAMTVEDIVNSEEFGKQYEKAIDAYSPHIREYYAYRSLLKKGILDIEAFRKEYIRCIDKESKLSFVKRVVVYSIGNDAYARTIKQMMKEYDELHKT